MIEISPFFFTMEGTMEQVKLRLELDRWGIWGLAMVKCVFAMDHVSLSFLSRTKLQRAPFQHGHNMKVNNQPAGLPWSVFSPFLLHGFLVRREGKKKKERKINYGKRGLVRKYAKNLIRVYYSQIENSHCWFRR